MIFRADHTRFRLSGGVIFDHGELPSCAPVPITAIEARWLATRLRHFGIEAPDRDGPDARYCAQRYGELSDALGAILRERREAA